MRDYREEFCLAFTLMSEILIRPPPPPLILNSRFPNNAARLLARLLWLSERSLLRLHELASPWGLLLLRLLALPVIRQVLVFLFVLFEFLGLPNVELVLIERRENVVSQSLPRFLRRTRRVKCHRRDIKHRRVLKELSEVWPTHHPFIKALHSF